MNPLRQTAAGMLAMAGLFVGTIEGAGQATDGPSPLVVFHLSSMTWFCDDALPRIVEAAPLVPPQATCAGMTQPFFGQLEIRVNARGEIARIGFADTKPPHAFREFLRSHLTAWKFDPARIDGHATTETLNVIYEVRPSPDQPAPAGGAATGPLPFVLVDPDYPTELQRPRPVEKHVEVRDIGSGAVGSYNGVIPPKAAIHQAVVLDDMRGSLWIDPRTIWLPGKVRIGFEVDEEGNAGHLRILQSSCSALDAPVAAAVAASRFHPAMQDGVPVRASREDTFVFAPEGWNFAPAFIHAEDDPALATTWDGPPQIECLAPPVHPYHLQRKGIRGIASVRVRLDADGRPQAVDVVTADRPEFGLALKAAALASRYAPARLQGVAVPATFRLKARFGFEQRMDSVPTLALEWNDHRRMVDDTELDHTLVRILAPEPVFASEDFEGDDAGSATVEFTVDPTGSVREPAIVEASRPGLGYTAVQYVANWRFEPPRAHGKPVVVRVRETFHPTLAR